MNRIDFMLPGTIEWIGTDLQLPEANTEVIAYGLNAYGKGRRMRAFYAPKYTIPDPSENDFSASEYHEEYNEFFLKEGWYETNEHEDVHWMIDFPVTHWMPLPPAPLSKEHLSAVRAHIPFMPAVRQARYADWDTILKVKSREKILTPDFIKKFSLENYKNTTARDIGNLAYVSLRSDYNQSMHASLILLKLRALEAKKLRAEEDHLLDTFGTGTTANSPMPFLK